MDGWVGGWTDRWTGGWMDGYRNIKNNNHISKYMNNTKKKKKVHLGSAGLREKHCVFPACCSVKMNHSSHSTTFRKNNRSITMHCQHRFSVIATGKNETVRQQTLQ